jgi:hypothetical protein
MSKGCLLTWISHFTDLSGSLRWLISSLLYPMDGNVIVLMWIFCDKWSGYNRNPPNKWSSLLHPFVLQRDGNHATGCINMGCRGFVRVNGAVIAPGDAIQPVSHVPGGQVQNITIIVLKVCVPSFIFIQPSWSHYFKCNSFLIKSC